VSRLGVLGWPVAHSRSPAMHNAALRELGLHEWRYQLLPVPPALFAETVRALPAACFRGANVTIPHKQAALALADAASERARAIGAANTLLFEPGGGIRADNTDAPALVAALPIDPAGATALVLGAGGSARAAVWALLDGGADVRVWNRSPERARRLCAELGGRPVSTATGADLLVNCTSIGLDGLPESLKDFPVAVDDLPDFRCVVDFVYGARATPLVRAARALEIMAVDGIELLVGQGALSFEQFIGRPAPTRTMREAVGWT
jgi:shikimate dehydrogenase